MLTTTNRLRRALVTLGSLGAATIFLAPFVARLGAQDAPTSRSATSVFFGAGWAALPGGASEGAVLGLNAGIARERPIRDRLALRTELLALVGGTDLGTTGSFALPTKITQTHLGISSMLKRYGARGRYLAFGGSLAFQTSCDVDTEGGPGFLGGETVDCDDFSEIPMESKSLAAGLLVAIGVQRTRFGLEGRLSQGLNATIETAAGSMTPRAFTVILNYRLRARR